MLFKDFLAKRNTISATQNIGNKALFEMAPAMRLKYTDQMIMEAKPRKAAVLALLFPEKETTYILLTKRASYKGTHSAQISFPGGKLEKGDTSESAGALRETWEEVGIPIKEMTILKEMSKTYIPPSNFLVQPFLAYTESPPRFNSNYEVAEIIKIPLQALLSDESVSKETLSTSYAQNITVPCFLFEEHMVWGATAMMLNEIKYLLRNSFK